MKPDKFNGETGSTGLTSAGKLGRNASVSAHLSTFSYLRVSPLFKFPPLCRLQLQLHDGRC